jgi:hypothetical protein
MTTFAQYCRQSGYRGDLDGLLSRQEATQSLIDSLLPDFRRQADLSAWIACQGGAGGPAITLGQIASASGAPVREIARAAGITEFMGESL